MSRHTFLRTLDACESRSIHAKDTGVLLQETSFQGTLMSWRGSRMRGYFYHTHNTQRQTCMSVSVDEITTLSVTLKHCLSAAQPERPWRASGCSDTAPRCGFMVLFVSRSSARDGERQPDRRALWAWFVFVFFISLSCHMVKVDSLGGR